MSVFNIDNTHILNTYNKHISRYLDHNFLITFTIYIHRITDKKNNIKTNLILFLQHVIIGYNLIYTYS